MGDVPSVCRIAGPDEPGQLFRRLGLAGRHTIVKPNWFSLHPGNYTDAAVLDLVLTALDGPVTVVESYTAMRHDGSRRITSRNARSHWGWLRAQDQWFLETTGIGAVLERHRATHICAAEEVGPGACGTRRCKGTASPRSGNGAPGAEGDVERRQLR